MPGRKTVATLLLLVVLAAAMPLRAQMTRGELTKKFVKITMLHNQGKNAEAIELCEEIVAMYPQLPITYLRMAQIYDDSGEERAALLMYRQWENLEMDENRLAEHRARIDSLQARYLAISVARDRMAEELPDKETDFLRGEGLNSEILGEVIAVSTAKVAASSVPGDTFGPYRPHGTDFLQKYSISRPSSISAPSGKEPALSPAFVEGKWASDLTLDNSGREAFIIDFQADGNSANVTLDSESGIFYAQQDLINASWNQIRSIWSSASKNFNFKELDNNISKASVSERQIAFSFEMKRKTKSDAISLSKNLIQDALALIPLNFISKLGGNILNQVMKNHQEITYQTRLSFNITPMNENVMKVKFNISEKQTVSGATREILIDQKTFNLYRCDDDFHYFEYVGPDYHSAPYVSLYKQVREDAREDSQKTFALAYLMYHGIGTTANVYAAMSQMKQLADGQDCMRARSWLAAVYYNLSLDEEHHPMKLVRRHFFNEADKQIEAMLDKKYPFAYGIKGDISSGSQDSPGQAIIYYKAGSGAGDPYCDYKLGLNALESSSDFKTAGTCFEDAARKGYSDAWCSIALGRRKDGDISGYVEALYCGLEAGSTECIKELSDAYAGGIGVNRSPEMSRQLKSAYYNEISGIWKGAVKEYGYDSEILR